MHLFLSWSLCVIKCLFKTLVPEETKLQWLHLYDFSPVCVFKWVLKMLVCVDAYHRRLLQGSYKVESCATSSPPSYTSSSPAYSSLALHIGRLCSWATTMSSKVRAERCASPSHSRLALYMVLLYVGHHQVLHMNMSCKHIHWG